MFVVQGESSKNVFLKKEPSKDIKTLQNQGAIPKTRLKQISGSNSKRSSQSGGVRKLNMKYNLYSEGQDNGVVDGDKLKTVPEKKKLKPERENGIIDEEDVDIIQVKTKGTYYWYNL